MVSRLYPSLSVYRAVAPASACRWAPSGCTAGRADSPRATRSTWPACSARSHSTHSAMPSPFFTDTVCMTAGVARFRTQARARSGSKSSSTGSRSLLVSRIRSAARNITGYLAGLSSPSGTDSSVMLRCWPRSKLAGHTRLPTFSMKTMSSSSSDSSCTASCTMCASRWQAVPVAIWMAGTPWRRMRSASFSVSRSPSMTPTRSSPASAWMVASSSAVLPAPGDDIRLTASTPWPSKCSRLWAAWWSFSLRRLRSTSTDLAPLAVRSNLPPGRMRCWLPAVMLQPQVSHMSGVLRGGAGVFLLDAAGAFEFEAGQQHLVAAHQPGSPVAAFAAQQPVGLGRGLGAADRAFYPDIGCLDEEFRFLGDGGAGGQWPGTAQQFGFDARERPDGEVYGGYAGRGFTPGDGLDLPDESLADGQLMHRLPQESRRRAPSWKPPPLPRPSGWRSRRARGRNRRVRRSRPAA